ncbi:ShlB/FhaC/HecB family hemolysin secretion/activation protein [Polaromonas sp. YR568]|uniref:ShlB/FhaC/HecB family hemolysin secretion/activation protein n=1 Tax=Polaromonas sp. YR568 TaxID=1855301 RepID=UPI001587EFB3|nr:ShlB/FhaC/HecB family hemolysin secretion/activation protein [Polaromonas sp. YR568]
MNRSKSLPFKPTVIGSLLALSGYGAFAQAPDAGRMLESIRERTPGMSNPAPSETPAVIERPADERTPPVADSGVRITVRQFEFSGNDSIDAQTLAAELGDFTGREIGFDALADAAARITRFYRSRGYLVARANLPAQDIAGGTVKLEIREGRLGTVTVEPAKNVRLDPDLIQRFISDLTPGAVIREAEIERSLLLLTDLPGINVRSVLRAGAQPGTADLVVRVSESPLAQARFGFDNQGNSYTGRNRLTLELSANDWLGFGESWTARGLTSFEGLTAQTLGVSAPIGGSGLRGGLSYTHLLYKIGRDFAPLEASGEGESASAFLAYPLIRSRKSNLTGQLTLEHKHYIDRVNQAGLDVKKSSSSGRFDLYGDWRDALAGSSALTQYSLGLTHGNLSRDTLSDAAFDDRSARTAGSFEKLNWSLSRLQALPGGFTLYASFSGQRASKNLDSSEEFFLGGINGVRAYPQGEGAGDEGWLSRLELRRSLGRVGGFGVEGFVFYDAGRVRIDKNPWDPAQVSNHRSLQGAGLGLILTRPKALTVSLGVAFRPSGGVSSVEPSRSPTLWVQVSGAPQAFAGLSSSASDDPELSQDKFEIFGGFGLEFERVSRDGATDAGPRGATQSATPTGRQLPPYMRYSDPSSSIGVRGALGLGGGLEAFWQVEAAVAYKYVPKDGGNTSRPESNAATSLQDAGVGLRSAEWGAVRYGQWTMPFRDMTAKFDAFNDYGIGGAGGIIGSPGLAVGSSTSEGPVTSAADSNNDDAAFIRRQPGVWQYATPEWNGLSGRIAYSDNGRRAAADLGSGSIWGLSGTYANGPLTLGVAYEQHNQYFGIASLGRNNRGVGSAGTAVTQGTSSRDWAVSFGASYRLGSTTFSMLLDKLSYSESDVIPGNTVLDLQSYRRRARLFGVTHTIGAWELRASAGRASAGSCDVVSNDPTLRSCSTAGLGATMVAVGFNRTINKNLSFYGTFSRIRNDGSASYNFRTGAVFAAAGNSPGVGADVLGYGLGFKYRF